MLNQTEHSAPLSLETSGPTISTISLNFLGNIDKVSEEFLKLIHETNDACILGKYWVDFLSSSDQIRILKVWHVYATTSVQEPLHLAFFWKNSQGQEIPLRVRFTKQHANHQNLQSTSYFGIAHLNDYVE